VRQVGAYEAKTHLPRLLDEVAAGETITITRHGTAVAQLSPVSTPASVSTREAIAGLRAFRGTHHLSGTSIRELIDEGRR
jgi:prevent-host-death family protein